MKHKVSQVLSVMSIFFVIISLTTSCGGWSKMPSVREAEDLIMYDYDEYLFSADPITHRVITIKLERIKGDRYADYRGDIFMENMEMSSTYSHEISAKYVQKDESLKYEIYIGEWVHDGIVLINQPNWLEAALD
jgi:hypothetical protein